MTCPVHGVVTCCVPWARHNSRFTYKFEKVAAWMAANCSKKTVAAFMQISWNTVGPMISRIEKDMDINPEKRYDNPVKIGVDETSYRKGQKYITTVVNHDTGNVIWVSQGHGKTVFEKFFKQLTPEQCGSIELVSGDGAGWIDDCIREYCPNAHSCVDPFHVIEWGMEALDSVRREAWRDAKEKAQKKIETEDLTKSEEMALRRDVSSVKNSRTTLGKAPENLTEFQKEKIELIQKTNNKLYRAYGLKEELRLIFSSDNVEDAKAMLKHWKNWASPLPSENYCS